MRTNPNMIGRLCMVEDMLDGPVHVYVAAVKVGPNRVRLQSGPHFGEVRAERQFKVMEFLSPGEAPPALAQVMAA